MIEYPEKLTFKALMSCDDDYKARKEFIEDVDTLHRGGRFIQEAKKKFLTKRLDEDDELYNLRCDRFVYTNILSEIIVKILGRFSTGDLLVSNLSESFSDSWNYFRENITRDRKEEKLFFGELLKQLLLHQEVLIQVDKPSAPTPPVNRAQEKELGLDRPFLVLYKPTELLNRGDGWYKFLVLTAIADPFGESYTKATWRFIDDTQVVEYQAVVKLKDGVIKYVVDPATGELAPVTDDTEIPVSGAIAHNFSKVPVVSLQIPDEQYAAGQAFLKVKQYLNVENGVTDTSLSSGYVQRVLTPTQQKEDDYNVIIDDDVKSDNQHVITAQSFKFEEIQGSSIDINLKFLDKIQIQVNNLVCISAGDTNKEALTRAAASKKMDANDFTLFLVSYGALLTSLYQDALQLVAEAIGDAIASQKVSVSGLDEFDLDDLSDDVAIANEILPIEDRLSPTALKLFYNKISLGLNKTIAADQRDIIEAEVQAMEIPPKPEPIKIDGLLTE